MSFSGEQGAPRAGEAPGPMHRRFMRAIALPAAVLGAVLAFHWRAALPGNAFADNDIWLFFVAERTAVADALRQLTLPEWERGIFFGLPLVGDPQAAVFDPATLITLPFDAPRALTIATFIHLVVMGWGMAAWARLRGLGAIEAVLGAVLFALGAKETVHLHHWNFAASTAWWPWMLAAVDGFAATGQRRWLWALAGATALSWFGGSPQMAYFGTLVAGAYLLLSMRALSGARSGDRVRLALALPLGLVLAAPFFLPVSQLASFGPRGGVGLGYEFVTSGKWPDAWALALMLLPNAYPKAWTNGPMNFWEATGYLGIVPLALVAANDFRRRGSVLLLVLLVGSVWASFGEDAWLGLHRVLYEVLPGFASFRVPTRGLMVASFASALLAAEGLHHLRTTPRPGAPLARAAAVLAIAAVATLALTRVRSPLQPDAVAAAARLCAVLIACGFAWVLAGRWFHRHAAWALAALALCGADLFATFGAMNLVIPVAAFRPMIQPFEPLIGPRGGPRRVASTLPSFPNDTMRLRWEGVFGYGPMMIERVRKLTEATRNGGKLMDERVANLLLPSGDPRSPLWPLLAAPVLVKTVSPGEHVAASLNRPGAPPLGLLHVPALPRVYWVGSYVVATDDAVEEPLARAAKGDVAVVASAPGMPSGDPAGPISASSIEVGPRSLDATVTAPRDGLAVIVDPWYPGWTAYVDGVETRILRANYAFQAIEVGAGEHHVHLEYRNQPLRRGMLVAALGVIALFALTWRRRNGA